jgi:hypothetical protein
MPRRYATEVTRAEAFPLRDGAPAHCGVTAVPGATTLAVAARATFSVPTFCNAGAVARGLLSAMAAAVVYTPALDVH